MSKLLLVDDEPALTAPLSRLLAQNGYQVDVAGDGAEGLALALANPYDLLILDWMLPRQSGVVLCQRLRAEKIQTPVLFLTAKDTLDDRVLGLDAGADDYLVKPFELRELLARVRALLRRSGGEGKHIGLPQAQVGGVELILDAANQVVYRGDQTIPLSEKEVKLLACLLERPGQVLSHEEIYGAIWGESPAPSSNVIAALVRLLRRKLESGASGPLIHTVYGKGYRLGAPLG
ncbi:MAG: response regulator [Cyanobacteria bacterium RI_101]|nr:response regulator [Cyanobacteria bacterium RI_101]